MSDNHQNRDTRSKQADNSSQDEEIVEMANVVDEADLENLLEDQRERRNDRKKLKKKGRSLLYDDDDTGRPVRFLKNNKRNKKRRIHPKGKLRPQDFDDWDEWDDVD